MRGYCLSYLPQFRCIQAQEVKYIRHYLDDFITAGSPGSMECAACACAANLAVTLSTFARLGVPIASEKSESSSTCITFLGKEADFQMIELRLPKEKLQRARAVVQQWLGRKAAKWRDLKSLEIYTSATCGESGTIWSQLCAAHYTADGISQEQRSTTL